MDNSVTVLMSTYNGERYLRQQIDSILNQKGVEVNLYIRDDGSSDNTLEIIGEYIGKYPRVHSLSGEPLGVGRSYMKLLFSVSLETNFYAFSDQDDIWDEDKLSSAIVAFQKFGNRPGLYVCNQRCVDSEGNFITKRFMDNFPKQELVNILFTNLYAGCTMVFDRALKELLCDKKRCPDIEFFRCRIHDAWIACVASLLDSIIFDSECHMSFRRHESNMTDAEVTRGRRTAANTVLTIYFRKLKRRLKKKTNLGHGIELTAENLLLGYDDLLSDNARELLIMVRDYRKSLGNKVRLLTSGVARRAAPEKYFDIVVKIVLGKL